MRADRHHDLDRPGTYRWHVCCHGPADRRLLGRLLGRDPELHHGRHAVLGRRFAGSEPGPAAAVNSATVAAGVRTITFASAHGLVAGSRFTLDNHGVAANSRWNGTFTALAAGLTATSARVTRVAACSRTLLRWRRCRPPPQRSSRIRHRPTSPTSCCRAGSPTSPVWCSTTSTVTVSVIRSEPGIPDLLSHRALAATRCRIRAPTSPSRTTPASTTSARVTHWDSS